MESFASHLPPFASPTWFTALRQKANGQSHVPSQHVQVHFVQSGPRGGLRAEDDGEFWNPITILLSRDQE